jgi:UDP:flavonoid glycosyltransferase YjiC (YdhE family)
MKMVFASLPAYGHVYPMLPLAQACVAVGHEVTFAVGEPFLDALPVPTVRALPDGVGLGDIKQETFRDHPELAPGPEFAARMFGETATRYTEPELRALFERERPDLVVYEVLDMGAALAAARLGIRAVCFGLVLWNPVVETFYEIAGADPTMPGGYLDTIPPSLQDPVPPPANRQAIRPVSWAPPAPLPAWLPSSPRRRGVAPGGAGDGGARRGRARRRRAGR